MDSSLVILVWVLAGAIGSGYMLYAKKQGRLVPFIAGLLLMVYPEFVDKTWQLLSIGIVLVIIPFLWRI